MLNNRYQIYLQEETSFKLAQSCCNWQEAAERALELQNNIKQRAYIVDVQASCNSNDVYRIDSSGIPVSTGHLARTLYEKVQLSPLNELTLEGVIEPLAITDALMVLKPLADADNETLALSGVDCKTTLSADSGVLEAPFSRQQQLGSDNDIALLVYCNEVLIATAVFSRYIEDHRFPVHQSELCYELSLHTVFVAPEYRGLGIATSLANTIVNIARKDMIQLHQVLLDANIRLKPWFSALALTPGGEAICDILSEAFVEMNDDVIEELMDEGVAISYQDPVIFVEGMA